MTTETLQQKLQEALKAVEYARQQARGWAERALLAQGQATMCQELLTAEAAAAKSEESAD